MKIILPPITIALLTLITVTGCNTNGDSTASSAEKKALDKDTNAMNQDQLSTSMPEEPVQNITKSIPEEDKLESITINNVESQDTSNPLHSQQKQQQNTSLTAEQIECQKYFESWLDIDNNNLIKYINNNHESMRSVSSFHSKSPLEQIAILSTLSDELEIQIKKELKFDCSVYFNTDNNILLRSGLYNTIMSLYKNHPSIFQQ